MKCSYKDLAFISENLSNLYDDGIPIDKALILLEELPLKKEYKKSLVVIKGNVMKGSTLGESFKDFQELYPSYFTGILSLGEESGELSKVLKNLGKYYSKSNWLRREIKVAMYYPIIILTSLVLFFIAAFFFVIPNIYESFMGINKSMPNLLELAYVSRNWIAKHCLLSFIAMFIWGISLFIFIKLIKESPTLKIGSFKLRVKFLRQYYEYVFILLLSVVLRSGITIVKGIDICIEATNKAVIKNEFIYINNCIFSGMDFKEAIKNNKFLSNYSKAIISLGENGGSLDIRLERLENRLEKSFNGKIKGLISLVTPVSMILMGVCVFLFILFVFLPIMDLLYSGYM